MDHIKTIKAVWKAVFGREPVVEIEDENPLTIRVDEFTLVQAEGEVEQKTIKGTTREKVMGWAADVFISTYSYADGYDGDTVDLGWMRNFGDALKIIVIANASKIVDDILYAESMAELCADNR